MANENQKNRRKRSQKRVPFSEQNRERVERMLNRDPGAVKAVIARTVETKKIANKLPILDTIFSNTRLTMGHKISVEDASKLIEDFKNLDSQMAALIDKAIELKVYTPRNDNKVTEFQRHKEQIVALMAAKKTAKAIAKELELEEQKVQTWIGTIKAEQSKQTETAS